MIRECFDMSHYEQRIAMARSAHANLNDSYKADAEEIPILSQHLKKVDNIDFDAVHQYGLIHVTADILILDSTNMVLLHSRRDPVNTEHGILTTSAGGHCQSDEIPIDTAVRELTEELGLVPLRREEIYCLSHNDVGWTNYVFSLVYTAPNKMLSLVWDDPFADEPRCFHTFGNVQVPSVSRRSFGSPWEPVTQYDGMRLSRWQFNQELCHYFVIRFRPSELRSLKIDPSEVCGIRYCSIDELSDLCKSPDATDSLWCLARNGGIESMKLWLNQTGR